MLSRPLAPFVAHSRALLCTKMEGFYDECLDASSGVYRFFQDGAWKTSSSGKTVKIINPSTNQPVFSVQGAHGPTPAAPVRPGCLQAPFSRCVVVAQADGPAGCRNGRNRANPGGGWAVNRPLPPCVRRPACLQPAPLLRLMPCSSPLRKPKR